MEKINKLLETVVGMVWDLPMVILLCGTGICLTLLLGLPQIRFFGHALKVVMGKYDDPNDPGFHIFKLCARPSLLLWD